MSQVIDFDPYAELGISPDAEPEVIAGAYRALARKYHPDLNSEGAERMKRINAAHDLLSDPKRRREYDRTRSKRAGAQASPPGPRTTRAGSAPKPPPSPPPACSGCGDRVNNAGELCPSCRAAQLRRQLLTALLLFVVPLLPAAVLLHSLAAAVVCCYALAAIPSGKRWVSRLRASSYAGLLPKPPPNPDEQPGYLIKVGLLIALAGVAWAPVDVARSAWELQRIRRPKRAPK